VLFLFSKVGDALKKIILLILLISLSFTNAQELNNTIKGNVVDKVTGEPIFNANIYLSGTEWGSTSNQEGEYLIKNIIPSDYQIVFSVIGYESQSKIITVKNHRTIELNIKLKPKSYELENVLVDSEYPESWYDDLKVFKKYFFGKTDFAKECKINNEFHLEFLHPQKEILVAKISRPLEIINFALGFRINCELINFKYDEEERRVKYLITTHFTRLDTLDEEVLNRWKQNRLAAYLGSQEHFLYTLNNNTFLNEGFEVSTSIVPSNSGYNLYRNMIFTSDSLLTASSIKNHSTLKFNKYLQVEYHRSSKKYRPISWLKILGIDVTLDKYGIPIEIMPFEVHGSWSQSGISDMLPRYFYVLNK
jgi:hypothetical protein